MSGVTAIEWSERVWNPVTGCSKVSEGCRNCYAETLSHRFRRTTKPWTAPYAAENVVLHPDRLADPLKWRKPALVFVNSMSDVFHENVPYEFIDRVFAAMAMTDHTFQVLTKRPHRMWRYMTYSLRENAVISAMDDDYDAVPGGKWAWPLSNVWLGVSTEDQQTAEERIPHLLNTPAAVRFLSAEPLLGPIDLRAIPDTVSPGGWVYDALAGGWYLPASDDGYPEVSGDGPDMGLIDWVIAGGESGMRSRPLDLDWARSLRDQCVAAGVPFFFKQVGGRTSKAGGRLLDGREWNEMPAVRP